MRNLLLGNRHEDLFASCERLHNNGFVNCTIS